MKPELPRRRWTKEEEEYLANAWGVKSYDAICRNLGRTKNAVRIRANILGLGPFLMSGEYITINQLSKALNGSPAHEGTIKAWIKRGFPVRYQTRHNFRCRVVKIDDFWEWAEQNRTFVNFSRLEPLALGKEPEWVEEQRREDFYCCSSRYKRWTPAEEERLEFLLKLHKYTGLEISEMFGRSEAAIRYECEKLGLKDRPLPSGTYGHRWTDEEIQTVIDGIMNGQSYSALARALGIAESSVSARVKTLYGTKHLDKAREIIKEQERLK